MTWAATGQKSAQLCAIGAGIGAAALSSVTTSQFQAQSAAAVAQNLLGPAPSFMFRGQDPSTAVPVGFCNLYTQIFNYDHSYRL
jgi:hypothetical protein